MTRYAVSKKASGLFTILIGIFILLITVPTFITYSKEPAYLYDLPFSQVSKGTYVQEDIYAALDSFMYEKTTIGRARITTTSYFYIIPIFDENGNTYYMALEVDKANESKMNSICEDSVSYLLGEMSDATFGYNTHYVKGIIRNMAQDELDYMIEWFQYTEFLGTTNETEIMKYIHPVVLQQDCELLVNIMLIAGIAFLIIGIFEVIYNIKLHQNLKKQDRDRVAARRAMYENRNIQHENYTYQTGFVPQTSLNQQNNEYLNQQNNGYLNQQNNGYLNQQNNEYLNQQNNGYLNQQNNEYLNQQNNGYLNQQNNGYLNQQNNGYLNQQNNGYLNQQNNGYLNQQNNGYLNQQNNGYLNQQNNGYLNQQNMFPNQSINTESSNASDFVN